MPPERPRILVVEDDPAVSRLLMRLLESAGHSVLAVSTGAEVAAALETGPFRFALVDAELPEGVDGVNVAREIRLSQPGALVVIMSGHSANLERAHAAGFPRGLAKPFRPEELLAALAAS